MTKFYTTVKNDFNHNVTKFNVGGNNQYGYVKGGKWGFLTIEDTVVIPAIYDYVEKFGENKLSAVTKDKLWGYINLQGQEIIPCIFKTQAIATKTLKLFYNTYSELYNNELITQYSISKKKEERELAAYLFVLKKDNTAALSMYKIEKTVPIQQVLLQLIGEEVLGNWKLEDWKNYFTTKKMSPARFTPTTKIYWQDGTEFTKVELLIERQKSTKIIQLEPLISYVLPFLTQQSKNSWAKEFINYYYGNNFSADNKYILVLAAALGGDNMVDTLQRLVVALVTNKKQIMAAYVIQAIVLQNSDKAIRSLDYLSRKYKVKPSNVGEAASSSLQVIATNRGMSIDDLGDLVIPDFEFQGLFYPFTIGAEVYKAFVDADGKIKYLDADNSILFKQPRGMDKAIVTHFKTVEKEVKAILKNQNLRMENYLISQRKWTIAAWKEFFMTKPVMFNYACSLVWQITDEYNKPTQNFTVQSDQTFVNNSYDEIELPTSGTIHLLHPLDITEQERTTWQQFLVDNVAPHFFAQMSRPIATWNEIKVLQHEFTVPHFYLFKSKNWKPIVGDGGVIEELQKDFAGTTVTILLTTHDGYIAAYGNLDEKTTISAIDFSNTATPIISEIASEVYGLLNGNK